MLFSEIRRTKELRQISSETDDNDDEKMTVQSKFLAKVMLIQNVLQCNFHLIVVIPLKIQ